MKASYEKPRIMFEHFELNQTIAANCGETAIGKTNHWSKSTCGYIVDDVVMWVNSTTKCDLEMDVDVDVQGYCYNTPTPNMQIFSS